MSSPVTELRPALSYVPALVILLGAVATASPPKSEPTRSSVSESDSLREAVLLALTANNEKLAGVQLRLREQVDNPGVTESKTMTINFPGGVAAHWSVGPRFVYYANIAITGEQLRFDRIESDGRVLQAFALENGIWKEYAPERQAFVLRRPDQMPALHALDPREPVAFDIRYPLRTLLEKSAFRLTIDADPTPFASKVERHRIYEAQFKREDGNTFLVNFDPGVALLPVQSSWFRPDGTLFRRTWVSYQRVRPRSAYVVQRIVSNCYFAGKVVKPGSPNQISTTDVEDVRLLGDKEAAQAVVLEVPSGVRIQDQTKPIGDPMRSRTMKKAGALWWWGLVVVNVAVLLIGSALLYRQRRSRVRSTS